jgi:transcriptional regulator GlxA family with amidase domain
MDDALRRPRRRLEADDFDPRLRDFEFTPPEWRPGIFDRDPRLRRLEPWIRQRASSRVTLADAARRACLTRCYFSTYFRRRSGIGFRDWIACLRVQAAARRLVDTEKSVAEIAWEVGFRDLRTFGRSFARITGTTPSRYRRRERARGRVYRRTSRMPPPEVRR